jgi:hypothetical protein
MKAIGGKTMKFKLILLKGYNEMPNSLWCHAHFL